MYKEVWEPPLFGRMEEKVKGTQPAEGIMELVEEEEGGGGGGYLH